MNSDRKKRQRQHIHILDFVAVSAICSPTADRTNESVYVLKQHVYGYTGMLCAGFFRIAHVVLVLMCVCVCRSIVSAVFAVSVCVRIAIVRAAAHRTLRAGSMSRLCNPNSTTRVWRERTPNVLQLVLSQWRTGRFGTAVRCVCICMSINVCVCVCVCTAVFCRLCPRIDEAVWRTFARLD